MVSRQFFLSFAYLYAATSTPHSTVLKHLYAFLPFCFQEASFMSAASTAALIYQQEDMFMKKPSIPCVLSQRQKKKQVSEAPTLLCCQK